MALEFKDPAWTREELLAKIYRDVLIKKPDPLPNAVKSHFAKIGGVK